MSIDARFAKFHNDNPQIYSLLRRFSLSAKNAGMHNYGMKAIFERVRWHVDVETKTRDGFRLSNDYTSRYARLLEREEPQLRGFFNMRPLRSQ
jgi:hypothetical protein